MPLTVSEVRVAAVPLAVVRRRAVQADLPKVVPDACGEVWRYLSANGIRGGKLVAIYLNGMMDLEIGAEVAPGFIGDGTVVPSATPAGRAAHALHRGPYHLLGPVHQALHHWLTARGLKIGLSWEVYGHWTNDPVQLETDIYYLLPP